MAWSKSVPRPAAFPLCVLPHDYLFPFPSQWLPFRQWHNVVVTGVGSLWSHLLWKEFWSDQMPPWKLKLNCLHFLSFYFNIPAVPAARVSTSNAAIHQLRAWPSASGKRPTPQKKSVLCFSFFFQSQKNLLIWIQGIVTFESKGKQLLGGNTQHFSHRPKITLTQGSSATEKPVRWSFWLNNNCIHLFN